MGKKRHKHGHGKPPGPRSPLPSPAAASNPVPVSGVQGYPLPLHAHPGHPHAGIPHDSPAAAAAIPAPAPIPAAAFPALPGRRRWRVAGLSAVGLGFLALAYHLRSVLSPVLLAFFLAYMLSPIVDFFERKGIARVSSISGLYLILFGTLTAIVVLAVPAAIGQADALIGVCFRGDTFDDQNQNGIWDPEEPLTRDWNGDGGWQASYLDRAIAKVKSVIEYLNERFPERRLSTDEAYQKFSELARKHASELTETGVDVGGTVARGVGTGLAGLFDVISYLVLVPIYIFFFLLGINRIRDSVVAHLPGRYRPDIVRILGRVHGALSSFFRGKILICVIKGLVVFLGLWICGVKFSLVFGLLAGIGSLVPFVPWIIGFVPAEIAVVMDSGLGLALAGPVVAFLLSEAAEFAVTPFVFGSETGLHPLSLILSLMLMGELFGFFGVLLAIPLVSIAKILFQEFVLPPLQALSHEAPEPPPA